MNFYFPDFWLRAYLTASTISTLLISRSTEKPLNNSSICVSKHETKKRRAENKKQQKQAAPGTKSFCKNCRKIEMMMNGTYRQDGCKSFIILLVLAGVKLTGSLYPDLSDQPGLPIGIKFCDDCEYEPNCYFLVWLAVSSLSSLSLCPPAPCWRLFHFSWGSLPVCSHTLHQQLHSSFQALTSIHPLCCGTLCSATPPQTRLSPLGADAQCNTDHKQNGGHDREGHPGKSKRLLLLHLHTLNKLLFI